MAAAELAAHKATDTVTDAPKKEEAHPQTASLLTERNNNLDFRAAPSKAADRILDPHADNAFTITQGDGGKAVGSPEKLGGTTPPPPFADDRQKVVQDFTRLGDSKDVPAIQKSMDDMEARVKSGDIAPAEVTKTYQQVEKLLENDSKVEGMTPENRLLLARDILKHGADPGEAGQGWHKTCLLMAADKKAMYDQPSVAAEMAVTAALTGSWTAPDGKVAKLDPKSLLPDSEAKGPDGKGRSYDMQILNQVTANDILQRRTPPLFYSQGPIENMMDTGDRTRNADGETVKMNSMGAIVPADAPNISDTEGEEFVRRTLGQDKSMIESPQMLRRHEIEEYDAAHNPPPAYDLLGHNDISKLRAPGSPEQLGETLQQMQDQKQLPAIAGIDYNHPAFGYMTDETGGNWHAVLITKYDADKGTVDISDSEPGHPRKITLSLQKLYESMWEYPAKD